MVDTFAQQIATLGTAFQAMAAFEISKVYRVSRMEAIHLGAGAILGSDPYVYGIRTAAVEAALLRESVTGVSVTILFLGLFLQGFASTINAASQSMLPGGIVLISIGIIMIVFWRGGSGYIERKLVRRRVIKDILEAQRMFSKSPLFKRPFFLEGITDEINEILHENLTPEKIGNLIETN